MKSARVNVCVASKPSPDQASASVNFGLAVDGGVDGQGPALAVPRAELRLTDGDQNVAATARLVSNPEVSNP